MNILGKDSIAWSNIHSLLFCSSSQDAEAKSEMILDEDTDDDEEEDTLKSSTSSKTDKTRR